MTYSVTLSKGCTRVTFVHCSYDLYC